MALNDDKLRSVTPSLPLDHRPGESVYLTGKHFADSGPGGLSYRRLKAYFSRSPTPNVHQASKDWKVSYKTIEAALEKWPDIVPQVGRKRDAAKAKRQAQEAAQDAKLAEEGAPRAFVEFMSQVPTPSVQDAMNHFGWGRHKVKQLLRVFPKIPRRLQGAEGQIEKQPSNRITKEALALVMSRVPTPTVREAAKLLGTNRHVVSWGLKQWPEIPRINRNTGKVQDDASRKRQIREEYLARMIRFRYRCRMKRLDPILVLSEYLRQWLIRNPSSNPNLEQLYLESIDELRRDLHGTDDDEAGDGQEGDWLQRATESLPGRV